MISDAFIMSFAATLFSMINPIGSMGIFASMTSDRPSDEAKHISIVCSLTVLATLLVVAWIGTSILDFFGISIASLQAAGGVIIFIIGLNMLFNKSDHKTSEDEFNDARNRLSIAVVPLGIPIVAGPGSMATVLVATSQHPEFMYKLQISVVIIVLSAITALLLYFARPISDLIGKSGMGVMTRLMGLILAAIAMGLFAQGLNTLFPGLKG